MLLKNEHLVVTLKGLMFTSHKMDGPHYRLDPEAITGWYDGVAMRREDSPRPVQWGSFEVPGYLGARLITITGSALATTAIELQAMRDIFMGVLVKGEFTQLSVASTSTGARFSNVGLEAAPSWVRQSDTIATWKLDLIAPDPRIYGEVNAWTYRGSNVEGGLDYPISYPIDYGVYDPSQTSPLTNIGNTDAWPVIIAEGNMPDGFKITNGKGDWVTYNGPVTFSSPVTINFATGVALQRGEDRSNNLVSREWFAIPPNSQLMPRFSYINPGFGQEGWIKVEIRDTWI